MNAYRVGYIVTCVCVTCQVKPGNAVFISLCHNICLSLLSGLLAAAATALLADIQWLLLDYYLYLHCLGSFDGFLRIKACNLMVAYEIKPMCSCTNAVPEGSIISNCCNTFSIICGILTRIVLYLTVLHTLVF